MEYQTVLFDFNGVLCNGRFYKNILLLDYYKEYDWITANIFGDKGLVQKWMRGKTDSAAINKFISEHTEIEYGLLHQMYEQSVHEMALETEMMNLVRSLKVSGVQVGIVTDNMDVFTEIIVPKHKLNTLFDGILNSADYGMLKQDNDGKLFEIALSALGADIEDSLMIDDSESTVELFKQKGGCGFLYSNFAELKSFLK